MARKKVEKDPTLTPRTMDVKMSDITTITVFAMTSNNISFKKHCEKLLSLEAKNIRKNKTSLASV